MSVVLFDADVSYNALFVALLKEIEAGLGFLAACSLCFPRLFKAKWGKVKQSLSPSTYGTKPTVGSSEKWGGPRGHTESGIVVTREVQVNPASA